MQEKKQQKGKVLMGLGLLFLAAAFVLAFRLIREERNADAASQSVLVQMEASASPAVTPLFTPLPSASPVLSQSSAATATLAPSAPVRALFEINPDMEMPITLIESNEYIGILDLLALGLSLPVMSDWSYPQLKIAPCRYKGSAYTGDLIISAHNYERNFGHLISMMIGD